MKKNIIKSLLLLVALFSCITLNAYSFINGKVFYNITSESDKTVEVTYVDEFNSYSGSIVIPATVSNEGVTYTVTSVGYMAFAYCYDLAAITIPKTVTSIDISAFEGTKSLNKFTVVAGNPNFSTIDGVLYNKDKTTIVAYPNMKSTTYTIPNSVTSIGQRAFWGCTKLKSVTIPNSVTTIDDIAFLGSGLVNVTIPDSVTSIGVNAFYSCPNLTNVTIGNSVTFIGESAFWDCKALKSVKIGNSVTKIGDAAFESCESLTTITIPNSVDTIGKGAFSSCYSLKEIIVSPENPNFSTIDGVLYNKDKTTILAFPNGNSTTYTIPDSVTSIGNSAFSGSKQLQSVKIGNSVTLIDRSAFSGCEGLTSITIPDSVTSIERRAFESCVGLTAIYNLSKTPQTITDYVFDLVDNTKCILYVPKGSKADYSAADVWKEFTNIQEID